jgi:hypothetical protein
MANHLPAWFQLGFAAAALLLAVAALLAGDYLPIAAPAALIAGLAAARAWSTLTRALRTTPRVRR